MYRYVLCLLTFASLVTWSHAGNTHDPVGRDQAKESQAWFGDTKTSYVAAGCSHGTSGTTAATIATCRAYALHAAPVRSLQYLEDLTARTITYSGGDGTYWLLAHSSLSDTLAGWTRVSGTHYAWQKATIQPALPSGGVWLLRALVAGGAITEVRRLMATNGQTPGVIYATDPLIDMKCDAVTDESAKLQLALALSSERGGTVVELPAGTCVAQAQIYQYAVALDTNQYGRGCASLRGQGIDHTTLIAPADIGAEEFVLDVYCPALGGGTDGGIPGANRATGAEIKSLTIAGRVGRTLEHHGMRFDGGNMHLTNVGFRWINGHALKMCHQKVTREVTLSGLVFRHSGRMVAEGGSTNNEAILIGLHGGSDPECNNIYINNSIIVFSYYGGLAIKNSIDKPNRAIFLNNIMLHGNEFPAATKQGRIADESGLIHIDGPGYNMALTNLFLTSPGSDNADTDNPANPSAAIHLTDTTATVGPNNISIIGAIGVVSQVGYFLKIDKARRVTITGSTVMTGQFPAGHVVIAPGGVTEFSSANLFVDTDKVNIDFADRALMMDQQYTLSWRVPTDLDLDGIHTEALETMPQTGIMQGTTPVCHIRGLQYTPFGDVTPGAGDTATFTFRMRGNGQNITLATLTINSTNPLQQYTAHTAAFGSATFPISASANQLRFEPLDYLSLQITKGGAGVALPDGLITVRCGQELPTEGQ